MIPAPTCAGPWRPRSRNAKDKQSLSSKRDASAFGQARPVSFIRSPTALRHYSADSEPLVAKVVIPAGTLAIVLQLYPPSEEIREASTRFRASSLHVHKVTGLRAAAGSATARAEPGKHNLPDCGHDLYLLRLRVRLKRYLALEVPSHSGSAASTLFPL